MNPSGDEAAVQVDRYLDELLATRSRAMGPADDAVAELAHAAAAVREALVRFHPSFRFEEELAARLRAVAAGTARAATLVRFPAPPAPALAAAGAVAAASRVAVEPPGDHLPPARTALADDPTATGAERGWVLVGGAIASGVSLAAGVLLARRRTRDHRWERLA